MEIDNDLLIYECPNCELFIETRMEDVCCGIFRHGVFKCNYQQIPPHADEQSIKHIKDNDQIYGCGLPYQITKDKDDIFQANKCGYI